MMQESDKTLPPSAGWLEGQPPRRRHLRLAMLCIVVIYLGGVTGKWWPTPDSALYLGLGRSLAAGEGYCFNGSVHSIVTPGLPAILAGLQMIFGETFWAPNLFMALCGLTSILFIYLVIARLSDRRMAMGVALATAMSFIFFHQSHRILTDAPFAAIFWVILYAYVRYRTGSVCWLILAGLLSAAAIAVRAPGILFLGSLAIAVMPDRAPGASSRKGLVLACVILAIIAVLGIGFFIVARSAAEGIPIYAKAILLKMNVQLTTHLRNLWLGLMQLPLTFSEMLTSQETYFVGLPALLLAGVGGVSLWKRRQRFVLPVIVLSVLALAFCGRDAAVRPRYLLPIHPLLLLALMEGLCWSIKRFDRSAGEKLLLKAVTVLVGVIIACNAPKLLRNAVYYSYLSRTPRYYQVIRNGKFAELFEVAEIIRRDHSDDKSACRERSRTAATNSDELSILHFLSKRVIAPFPKIASRRPVHAEKIHRFVISHSDLKFIVLDTGSSDGSESFRRRLKKLFENTAGLELRHDGERYRVYEKTELSGRCPEIYGVNRGTL